jgi:hypothetical protein
MPENSKFIEGGFEINKRISEFFVGTAQREAHFNGNDVAFVNDYQLMIMGKVMDEEKMGCLKSFHYHIPVLNGKPRYGDAKYVFATPGGLARELKVGFTPFG